MINKMIAAGTLSLLLLLSCKKNKDCVDCNQFPNKLPLAKAGSDQTISLPQDTIKLDGSSSHDSDGTIAEYFWKQVSGPSSGNIVDPNKATTVVRNLIMGIYQFELSVIDNKGAYARDTTQLTVNGLMNNAPIVKAGLDQVIHLPTNTVLLNGSGTTDLENNISTYQWSKIAGPASFDIQQPSSMNTTVINLVRGHYQFMLTVTDQGMLTGRDTVDVHVIQNNTCAGVHSNIPVQMVLVGNLSKARTDMAVVNAGSKIFFAGGRTGGGSEQWGTSRVDIYDLSSNSWSTAELSAARYGIAAIVAGNRVFFAGGVSGILGDVQDFYSTIDVYDLMTNSWSVSNMPMKIAEGSIATAGNKIAIAGGLAPLTIGQVTYYTFPNDKVNILDLNSNTWTTHTLNPGRHHIRAVSNGGKIHFAGGNWLGGQFTSTINIYDALNNTWSQSRLSEAKVLDGGTVFNDKIYWSGGYNMVSRICDVEIIDLLTQITTFTSLSNTDIGIPIVVGNNITFHGPASFDIYDPITHAWKTGLLSQTIYTNNKIAVNNSIYIAGGLDANSVVRSEVWKIDF